MIQTQVVRVLCKKYWFLPRAEKRPTLVLKEAETEIQMESSSQQKLKGSETVSVQTKLVRQKKTGLERKVCIYKNW